MLAAETPFFLEAVVGKEDNVFPMVPAGAASADMIDAPEWAGITDWADELAPYFDQAKRMLGAFGDAPDVVVSGINRGGNLGAERGRHQHRPNSQTLGGDSTYVSLDGQKLEPLLNPPPCAETGR